MGRSLCMLVNKDEEIVEHLKEHSIIPLDRPGKSKKFSDCPIPLNPRTSQNKL